MSFKQEYEKKKMSFKDAVKLVQDGDRINIAGCNALSEPLVEELYNRRNELKDISVLGFLVANDIKILGRDCDHISYKSTFLGGYERAAQKNGRIIDNFSFQLRNNRVTIQRNFDPTVLFIMATPMDDEGYFNLSLSPAEMNFLADTARLTIVHVNDQLPVVNTEENKVHISKVHVICEQSQVVPTLPNSEPSELDKKVASYIVERIPNGACLQIGIGGIANAVGFSLVNHKHLGVYTEMYTESMYYLTKKGAIDNSRKKLYSGQSVLGFAMGSKEMYDWLNNNKDVFSRPLEFTNDPYLVAQHDNFVSVNACLQVDITGQVCSEAIGKTQFSGTGGQVDFVRGSQLSKGGQSFIAMQSTAEKKDGTKISKIVMSHSEGSIITTGRTDVQYIVTEYGIADLQNKSRMQRAKALIAIAHPDFRDELAYQAKKDGYL
ncbi:MAG: acetyl-CoA hydrolase/transferase C-terminal domain-containing protein [Eubacteriaceae bacterium]